MTVQYLLIQTQALGKIGAIIFKVDEVASAAPPSSLVL
jgi:hypothetical protein